MRKLVFPSDPVLREVFGSDDPSGRAYRARLERAERRGTLPRRVYVSPRRFGWDAEELRTALDSLPRTYAGFGPAGA
jgi:hypothetical protein